MTVKQLKEFAGLYANGFRPYHGDIEASVYARLECRTPQKAFWVSRWPIMHCFGCSKRCTPATTEGFQVALPMVSNQRETEFGITPSQMVASKELLRADEAAYCLNVSRREVYSLASVGRLVRHLERPFRVTTESVREEMGRVDL